MSNKNKFSSKALVNMACAAPVAPPLINGADACRGEAAKSRFSISLDAMRDALIYALPVALAFIMVMTFAANAQTHLTLEQCINMALSSNHNLVIATERIAEREAALKEATAANRPRLSASAGYTYLIPGITGFLSGTQRADVGINPMFLDAHSDGTLSNILDAISQEAGMHIDYIPFERRVFDYKVSPHVWNADLTASYVLYSGGRVQNARRIAEQQLDMTEWQRKSAEREVRRDVTRAYYQALSVSQNIIALDSAIALMEVVIRDMNNMVEAGMLGEHEVLLMEVELSNLRLSRQQVVTGAQSAHDYLAMLIGAPINAGVTLANELQAPETFNLPELTSLQARAINASTDIKALEEQLRIIETSISITDAANLPTIVAAAGYRGSHQGRAIEPRKDDWEWDNQAFVSLQAQWDIWDGNAKRHKRGQARSQKRQLELTIENIKVNLDMGVKVSAANVQEAYDAIEVNRKSIEQAKRSYEISYDKFREGMIPSSELLRAQTSIVQSEVAYYNAISTFFIRMADLDYLVNEVR